MKEIELRRKMKATVVPTNDQEVRRMLRQLREPITLFGEREVSEGCGPGHAPGHMADDLAVAMVAIAVLCTACSPCKRFASCRPVPCSRADPRSLLPPPPLLPARTQMERRDRLRKMLAGMDEQQAVAALGPPTDFEMAEAELAVAVPSTEVFYTEGSQQLRAARHDVAQFSLRRAALRLAAARRRRSDPDEDEAAAAAGTERQLRAMANQASEIGDERPIAGCAFSPDGSQLATGAWSGTLKVWAMPSLTKQLTIKAHTERVTGVAWHPEAASTTGGGAGLGEPAAAPSTCMHGWAP